MQLTNQIHFRNLQGDLFGGITAAVIALPLALAFGVASGAGATAGLWGAVLVGFFAALFGGTPTLISEPTGPMTVIMTAVIANLTATDPEHGLAMAFTVVMMAGVFQILFGVLKLGKYVTMMPYTVISGFMSGIGIILTLLQLSPFLGQASPPGGVLGTLQALPTLLTNIRPAETFLATLSIAIIWFYPSKYKRKIPPQLVALIVGTVISLVFFQNLEIRRIDDIPMGFPDLQLPTLSFSTLRLMLVDAVVLGMLGCIDALLTSVVADSLTRTEHNSNKELIGQGLGNIASGLFGGLPGAGATMGTVVNIQAGGRSALSGLVRAVILLVVILGAADLTETIPLAVLAGIALKVGIDIIDWGFLKRAHKISPKAAGVMYMVMFLTVFVDLITAVAIGVFVANILTLQRQAEVWSEEVKAIQTPDDESLNAEEKALLRGADGRILLFSLGGPMSFGAAKTISRRLAIVGDYDVLILDMTQVRAVGVTASLAIENMVREAIARKRQVYVVGVSGSVSQRLRKLDVLNRIPLDRQVDNRLEALTMASKSLRELAAPATPPAEVASNLER